MQWIKPGHAPMSSYGMTAVAEEHHLGLVPRDRSAGRGVRQSHASDGSLREGAFLTATAGCWTLCFGKSHIGWCPTWNIPVRSCCVRTSKKCPIMHMNSSSCNHFGQVQHVCQSANVLSAKIHPLCLWQFAVPDDSK